MDVQSKAELRVRLYSICSWCAELIDRQQSQQPRRRVEAEDLAVHVPQQHALWLQMLTSARQSAEEAWLRARDSDVALCGWRPIRRGARARLGMLGHRPGRRI